MKFYRELLCVFSDDNQVIDSNKFHQVLREIWINSLERPDTSGISFRGDYFEQDTYDEIFELLGPFVSEDQKLFFRFVECKSLSFGQYKLIFKEKAADSYYRKLKEKQEKVRGKCRDASIMKTIDDLSEDIESIKVFLGDVYD